MVSPSNHGRAGSRPAVIMTMALSVFVYLCACSRPLAHNQALLDHLSERMKLQYHECVPLGWTPVRAGASFYPGYTATQATYVEFLDAIWRGHVGKIELRNRDAAVTFDVLNHLVQAGMLTRTENSSGYDYFLTWNSIPYFYAYNVYRNNRGSQPYFCYSTIVPTRVVLVEPATPDPGYRLKRGHLYRVAFSWTASAPAGWAVDPFLRSHSVILAPVRSPVSAKMLYYGGQWWLLNLYDHGYMLPQLADATAW